MLLLGSARQRRVVATASSSIAFARSLHFQATKSAEYRDGTLLAYCQADVIRIPKHRAERGAVFHALGHGRVARDAGAGNKRGRNCRVLVSRDADWRCRHWEACTGATSL